MVAIAEQIPGTIADPRYGNTKTGFLDPDGTLIHAYRFGSAINGSPLKDLVSNVINVVSVGGAVTINAEGALSDGTKFLETQWSIGDLYNAGDDGFTAIYVGKSPLGGTNYFMRPGNAGVGNCPTLYSNNGTDALAGLDGNTQALRAGGGAWRGAEYYVAGLQCDGEGIRAFRARYQDPANFRDQTGQLQFALFVPADPSLLNASTRTTRIGSGSVGAPMTTAAAAFYSGALSERDIERVVAEEIRTSREFGLI